MIVSGFVPRRCASRENTKCLFASASCVYLHFFVFVVSERIFTPRPSFSTVITYTQPHLKFFQVNFSNANDHAIPRSITKDCVVYECILIIIILSETFLWIIIYLIIKISRFLSFENFQMSDDMSSILEINLFV